MAAGLIPEMAESVFLPLLKRLDNHDSKRDWSAHDILDLVSACGIGAALLEQLIGRFRQILQQGAEKRLLHSLQKELVEVVSLVATTVYPKVRELAASQLLTREERETSLTALQGHIKQADAIVEELRKIECLLTRPKPTVHTAAFGKLTNDYQGYEDTRDIELRLPADGDI